MVYNIKNLILILILFFFNSCYNFHSYNLITTNKFNSIKIGNFLNLSKSHNNSFLIFKFSNYIKNFFRFKTPLYISDNNNYDFFLEGELKDYNIEFINNKDDKYINKLSLLFDIHFINNNFPKKSFQEEFKEEIIFYQNNGDEILIDNLDDKVINDIFKKISEKIFNRIYLNF